MTDQQVESTLEIVRIDDGERAIVLRDEQLFEAPNWSRNGRFFVVNAGGKLYRVDRNNPAMHLIDSGFADRNNNDHGISPDGSTLVISHHAAEADGESIIYTLPITGGAPRKITPRGPSYWHGWSPDGKTLVYVAGRDSDKGYCIYQIPVEGGDERRLTDGDWLDDGPDFTPDGKTIYFNSARSGRMQIWRMAADGSNVEQVVFSDGSDWFPHPSPDGRHLVFLRYLDDQGEAHPFGRDVQLMLMHTGDGTTQPLTQVFFGGQGTINVPSWSPDSREVAFVSYRLLN